MDFFKRINKHLKNQLKVFYSDSDFRKLSQSPRNYAWAEKLGPLIQILPGIYWQFGALSINITKADFVVVCGAPRNLTTIFLLIKAKLQNKKTIWWGHYWSSSSKKYRQIIRIYISKLSSALLFYTDAEVEKFKKDGWISKQKLGALNNGIDISEISKLRLSYDFKNRSPNILFIGRLTEKSNLKTLIEAIYILRDKKFKLNIIGDGNLYEELIDKANNLKINNIIKFHGGTNNEKIISEIANSCSIFVYPGSVGLSLIHAMSYGLPCIVHNNIQHHMPEIAAFKEKVNGYFFEENSAIDLSKVIVKLMELGSLREQMSKNSINSVEENYNTANMAKRFIDFLHLTNY